MYSLGLSRDRWMTQDKRTLAEVGNDLMGPAICLLRLRGRLLARRCRRSRRESGLQSFNSGPTRAYLIIRFVVWNLRDQISCDHAYRFSRTCCTPYHAGVRQQRRQGVAASAYQRGRRRDSRDAPGNAFRREGTPYRVSHHVD